MNKIICLLCMLFFICMHSLSASAQSSSSKNFTGPVIYINLMRQASNPVLVDGVAAMYSNKFSSAVDSNDAQKLYNINQGIFLSRNSKNLSVEARQIPLFKDTLFIQLWALKQVHYSLKIIPQNIVGMMAGKAWLIDRYLQTQEDVDLEKPTLYNFKPDSNNNSYLNRFIIVYNRLRQATPVNLKTNNFGSIDSINQAGKISLYPNPVVGKIINLKFENEMKGDYNIILTDQSGNVVYKNKLHHAGGDNNYTLTTDPNKINTGLYTLVILGNHEKIIHLPLIINK